jgi:hypothetical protein
MKYPAPLALRVDEVVARLRARLASEEFRLVRPLCSLEEAEDPVMESAPISWHCPRCGLADGWDVAPGLRRAWVEASCPACDCDYRVRITQPAQGAPRCQVVYSDLGIIPSPD